MKGDVSVTTFSTVLFDLDGTLIDTNHLIVTSFQHVFKEHLRIDVPAEEIYPYFGEPLPRTMARYDPDRADELCVLYRTFNASQHDVLIRQFAGMVEAMSSMKEAGVKLGIVTSKRTDTALRGLKVCKLDSFFPTIVGMDATEKHKPDPEPCLEALRRMGEKAGPHVLMVGDSHFDIECGRNAGAKTVGVGWAANPGPLRASQPDYWVESPSDLVNLVLGS